MIRVVRTAADLPDGLRELVVDARGAWQARDYARARAGFESALRLARKLGDRFGEMSAYHFLGNVAFNECRDEDSRRFHTLALELAREDRDEQGIATSLGSLALVDVADGRLEAARARFAKAATAYERAEMPDAADQLRTTARSLLDQGVPLETLMHRAPRSADARV